MSDPIKPSLPAEDRPVAHVPEPRPDLPKSRRQEDALLRELTINREENQLRAVINTEDGQAIIMRLLDRCGIYARGALSEFAQGRRDVGMELVREIAGLGHDAYEMLKIDYRQRAQRWLAEDEARLENSRAAPPPSPQS